MQLKFLLVCFLAVALLVSMTEAGKDRRKKQKAKERAEDDEANEEMAGGKGLEESGKGKEDKERSSVLEKQSEKKDDEDESSSEEDDEKEEEPKKNSTIIVRMKRSGEGVVLPTDNINDDDNRLPELKRFVRSIIYRIKRDTAKIQKSKEINDGVQIPLDKKPAQTTSN